MQSWDGHSLEEYLGADGAPAAADADPAPEAEVHVGEDEESGEAFSHPPAFTDGTVADAGGVRDLPPTADPDDTDDEADDYLAAGGGVDSGLDLEPVANESTDPELDREVDEVLDLVSDPEIEAVGGDDPSAQLERMGLPPVPEDEPVMDSADPDTIVAADEPAPAVEPSVDYLRFTDAPEAPEAPEGEGGGELEDDRPSTGDMPDWLEDREGPGEDPDEEDMDLSTSLAPIPESARLSQLDDTVEGEDDLSGELELDSEDEEGAGTDEPPTPARGARRPAKGEEPDEPVER